VVYASLLVSKDEVAGYVPRAVVGAVRGLAGPHGVVLATEPGLSKAELLRKAHIALSEAKARGGRRSEIFTAEMDELVLQRRQIEQDLRLALNSDTGLRVMFQPIFAANGTTMAGAEALIRWDHPVHGRLSPEIFVGVAEERGLIELLTAKVLRATCTMLMDVDLPWAAVNVSPIQLRDARFAAFVLDMLTEYGLAPHRLQIEITESALIEDSRVVAETLNRLRNAGVIIALDDFGTGYSSMNYLRDYPVDKIKIDQSFVRQLGRAPESDAIVRAMVALARAMKKRVVAEGVETPEQRDHLAALGCHELQGFCLSMPLSLDELAHLSRSGHHANPLRRDRALRIGRW
jgi:EAL domain-containing protein (putative c-di-GMP-specific phosphodiesterase class I)